jgi:2-polyprenyl-3-methyl-5-hydroxy-6-metoxy-1,4-benzoquinol methylase
VRALFNGKAAGWPAKYAADGRLTGRLAQLAAALGDLAVPGSQVLDLGCGSGELARLLAASGYRVTGCDIAPAMVHRAAAADQERAVRWILLEPCWRALPCAAASFKVVVGASVFEYLLDPAAVLAECARVLRPGGFLVCTVPNVAHPVRWLEWPLCLAVRTPLAAVAAPLAAGRSQRIAQYLAYLGTSCQRRRAGWWYAQAGRAGFAPVPAERKAREPLRMLIFEVPGGTARHRPAIPEEQ